MAERPQGYLVLTAIEASGRNKDDSFVWGPEGDTFDGYVKGGLSGKAGAGVGAVRCSLCSGSVPRATRCTPLCCHSAQAAPPRHGWRLGAQRGAEGRTADRRLQQRATLRPRGGRAPPAVAGATPPSMRAQPAPAAPRPRAFAPCLHTRPPRPAVPRRALATVELRGGARNVKVATRRAPLQGSTVFWNEPLVL
jgi:hypothetical protein